MMGLNPSPREPDAPPKEPKDVDKCETADESSQVGSFMYSLAWGGIPAQSGLTSGSFIIRENQPSPAMFTSGVVYYQHPAAVQLTDLVSNDGYQIKASIIGSDSLPIDFAVAFGQSSGAPTGQRVASSQRLMLLDALGQPLVAGGGGAMPTSLRIIYEDASSVDIDTATKVATRFRSSTGAEVIFATLPASIALNLIYKDGGLRQVRAVAGLADLVSRGELGFEIRLYGPGSEGTINATTGLYVPIGTPYRTVFFENPNAASEVYNSIKITDTWGSLVKVDTFDYNTVISDWTLSRGQGPTQPALRRESKILVPGPGANEFTYHIFLTDDTQRIISKRDEIYHEYPWGKEKIAEILEPGTLDHQTTYVYNTSASGYGKLNHVIYPDGSWEAFEYDVARRVISKSTSWKDSVYSANSTTQRRIITYDYTSLDAADTLYAYNLPRTETESIITADGAAPIVVGRTYHVYKGDSAGQSVIIEEKASSSSSPYGSAFNPRTTSVAYTGDPTKPGYNSAAAGRLYYEDLADGTRTTYTYTQDFTTPLAAFVTSAVRATASSPTGVDGLSTRTDTVYNIEGIKVRTQSYIFKNSTWYPTRNLVETVSPEVLKTTARTLDGRQIYGAVYDGARLSSETDESGVTTSYTYDSLGKIESTTRKGVPASGSYAAQLDIKIDFQRSLGGLSCGCDGEVVTTVSSGGLSLTSVVRKDQIGRLVYEKDSAGLETNYIYTLGGRQVTRLNPDSGTVVTLKYRDGRVQSESGTGTNARAFDYGVNADGTQWTQVTLGARNERSTNDFLGRTIKAEQPAYDGGTLVVTQSYDAQGRLARSGQSYTASGTGTETKVMANTLYVYDVMGNLTRTGLDIDGDGMLSPISADRITETQTGFAQYESAWWSVQKTFVYPTLDSGTSVQISETRQRLSSFTGTFAEDSVSIDIHGNVTRRRTNIDPPAKLTTRTVTQPESNITATQVVYNGLVVAENSATVSSPTTYLHDALGRVVSAKDPRKAHTETTAYDPVTGQIISVKDAAGNPTTVAYYSNGVAGAGRPRVITDTLGKTKRLAYDLQGRAIYQWGTAVYPQAMDYNALGLMATSTTWRDTASADLNATAWPAPTDGDVTTWTYDLASGLLTRKAYADGNGTDYTYDKANRPTARTWNRSVLSARVATTLGYDPASGDLLTVTYSDSTPSVAISYDRLGRQTTVTDAAGPRTFSYDPARLTLATETLPATFYGSRVMTYDYQSTGTGLVPGRFGGYRLGTVLTPAQDFSASFGYDAQGRFTMITSGVGAFVYAYTPSSNLLASITGPKVKTTYAYETDRDVWTQVANVVGASSISRYSYEVDVIGRRSNSVKDGTAFAASTYDRFDYNDRNEVTGSRNYTGTTPANYLTDTQSAALARIYSFDPIGNRLTSTEGTASARAYMPNVLNQYSGITNPSFAPTFDLDGNQTFDGSGWYYSWDAENRLVSARKYLASPVSGSQKIDFVYDFKSRRVRRTMSTYSGSVWTVTDDRKFVYQGWNVVAELNATTNSIQTSYTWGLDLSQSHQGAGGVAGLLAATTYSPSAANFFATYDGNGNVSEYVNSAGTVEAHFGYDAFGQTTVASGTNLGRFAYRFSTKFEEPLLGLYYYGLRYYNPSTGRWPSKDPISEKGGLNLYGFVRNCPVNYCDYLGRDTISPSWVPQTPPSGFMGRIDISRSEFAGGINSTPGQQIPSWVTSSLDTGCIGVCRIFQGNPDRYTRPEKFKNTGCYLSYSEATEAGNLCKANCGVPYYFSVQGSWKKTGDDEDSRTRPVPNSDDKTVDPESVDLESSYNYITYFPSLDAWGGANHGIGTFKEVKYQRKDQRFYLIKQPPVEGDWATVWCVTCKKKNK